MLLLYTKHVLHYLALQCLSEDIHPSHHAFLQLQFPCAEDNLALLKCSSENASFRPKDL